jgi:hypothetical protein
VLIKAERLIKALYKLEGDVEGVNWWNFYLWLQICKRCGNIGCDNCQCNCLTWYLRCVQSYPLQVCVVAGTVLSWRQAVKWQVCTVQHCPHSSALPSTEWKQHNELTIQ